VLHGAGAVFQVTPKGRETVFHTFLVSDGDNPANGLIAVPAKRSTLLYGTTVSGGTQNGGTVFQLKE
jgi:hypothetical protein